VVSAQALGLRREQSLPPTSASRHNHPEHPDVGVRPNRRPPRAQRAREDVIGAPTARRHLKSIASAEQIRSTPAGTARQAATYASTNPQVKQYVAAQADRAEHAVPPLTRKRSLVQSQYRPPAKTASPGLGRGRLTQNLTPTQACGVERQPSSADEPLPRGRLGASSAGSPLAVPPPVSPPSASLIRPSAVAISVSNTSLQTPSVTAMLA
jgi:hypothetical protein